jgi:hypothetical protein
LSYPEANKDKYGERIKKGADIERKKERKK